MTDTRKQRKRVYEFRPLPTFFLGGVRRYADGKWIPDDGEYDLAFIGTARSKENWGYPCCLCIKDRCENVLAAWTTNGWGAREPRHDDGNPWHYALRKGAKDWGETAYNSLYRMAGDSGMHKQSSESGASNGRYVELDKPDDPHILAGLVRDRETKQPFTWPADLACMYCGEIPPIQRDDYEKAREEKRRADIQKQIAMKRAEIAKLEGQLVKP